MLRMLKNNLGTALSTFRNSYKKEDGEFSRRIINRHRAFWKAADAEFIRNLPMNHSIPKEQWKVGNNWQRKLSNKSNAREFAKMHGCRVPELYWKGRDLSLLDTKKLPGQYVIRPTIGHSCNMIYLMDNGLNLMDRRSYSANDLKQQMAEALQKNTHLEFLVEEFIRTEKGEYKIPNDYKMSFFNGELAVIDVINRLSPKTGFSSCYDANWNPIDNISPHYQKAPYQEPPACLDEMITLAKKLSRSYEIFVRIDFYATDKGAVFGEFTPTPSCGRGFTPEADKMLAEYWDRYCHGMI
ncbi:ATP-grasp fold amidoligase family protein [Pontibacter sp. MBLB2868]|uniref:ATP-grasp fold amidoligase family protein n=1 Tax=Pontibacter sp. MBLB2868 TaxID=3451555 RepID=UPI003F753F0F